MEQSRGREIAPLPQLGEPINQLLKLIESPIDLSMPELPFEGADVVIDMGHFTLPSVAPMRDVIGDLLERLNLHGDVKPIDYMRRRLGQRLRQSFHDLGAIGKHRHLAATRIALAL